MPTSEPEKPADGTAGPDAAKDFVRAAVAEDVRAGTYDGRVHTRFPPEPNGYLHIGHAKAICIDFGIAEEFDGLCNLRMDDTNPTREEAEYVEAIKEDVRWLGFDWGDRFFYASDYFEQLAEWAVELIRQGKAYVDDSPAEEIRRTRGTLTTPGQDSPYRNRSVEENLELFSRMRAGEFGDGEKVLRARIDMNSPNLNLRDPVMYRIQHARHHRTGNKWCIYPMYDWAHGLEDSIEGITHSLCSLEFENHRPLYEWFLDQLPVHKPRQIEFARLNLSYTVMSKRKLMRLVDESYVDGWDDPRMPTLCGLRRRGVPPQAIRNFCARIGVTKYNSITQMSVLEHCTREHLNAGAPRRMAVLDPIKLVIENYPDEQVEWLEAINNPEDETAGTRQIPFSKTLYIEREDFREEAPRKFHRLVPGREVRLRYGYLVTCTDCRKDADGKIVEVHCTYDPATRGGAAPDGRKVKGTIHWVSAGHAVSATVRLYDRLFLAENPDDAPEGQDFTANFNPQSREVLEHCRVEPALGDTAGEQGTVQFERKGYFRLDEKDSAPGCPVFNRTVSLKDSWAKIEKKK
ncbi:MAG: glutamine--tRNA ligase/YqeY domain fusion protein [Verrucomicrobiota bacterium]